MIPTPAAHSAAFTLQSYWRGYLARKTFRLERLFQEARKYTADAAKLHNTPHAPNGASRATIYMPSDLPLVIRSYQVEGGEQRFFKVLQARQLCYEKNRFRYLAIPEVRRQGPFTVEQRLPNENNSPIKGMTYYYEHRDAYTPAIREFILFLCQGDLSDLIGGNKYILNFLGMMDVPRFDNLLLYQVAGGYKIGIVDFETFELKSYPRVYFALKTCVQLFPYHLDAILEVGQTLCDLTAQQVEALRDYAQSSRGLYQIVCEQPLSFYRRQGITFENQSLFPLPNERRAALKDQMGAFVLHIHDHGLEGYLGIRGCLNGNPDVSARRFQEELFPKMLEMVESSFSSIHAHCWRGPPITSYGALIERRACFRGVTNGLRYKFEESADPKVLQEVFEGDYPPIFAIFEGILNLLVKGGDLSYYKARVYSDQDVIFF